MIILQLPAQAELMTQAGRTLIDYGLLGTVAVILFLVVGYLEKLRNTSNTEMKSTIKILETKVDAQQKEQEAQQLSHVEFIKTEYKQSMEINRRCLEVLDDVKDILKRTSFKN